jgi:hypothetical protein
MAISSQAMIHELLGFRDGTVVLDTPKVPEEYRWVGKGDGVPSCVHTQTDTSRPHEGVQPTPTNASSKRAA